MAEILNVRSAVNFDESVSHYEIHAHQPYNLPQFNNNDEIRIAIQHQDLNLLPFRISLHIYGKLTQTNGGADVNTRLVNIAVCHLFEEIRYELNGIKIDRCKYVGLTTMMKGYVAYNFSQTVVLENDGWVDVGETATIVDANGSFGIFIPLRMISWFR